MTRVCISLNQTFDGSEGKMFYIIFRQKFQSSDHSGLSRINFTLAIFNLQLGPKNHFHFR